MTYSEIYVKGEKYYYEYSKQSTEIFLADETPLYKFNYFIHIDMIYKFLEGYDLGNKYGKSIGKLTEANRIKANIHKLLNI